MNYCRLALLFDPELLARDLGLIESQEWVMHYNAGDFEGCWSGVALRGLGGQAGNLRALPRAQVLYEDTPLLSRCPYFQHVLHAFECPLGAVRLLSLDAGSVIHEHRDDQLAAGDAEVRLHVPVQTDPAVEFTLDHQRLHMAPGECWFLDVTRPHAVTNRSQHARVHLVLDCLVNPWLQQHLEHAGWEAQYKESV